MSKQYLPALRMYSKYILPAYICKTEKPVVQEGWSECLLLQSRWKRRTYLDNQRNGIKMIYNLTHKDRLFVIQADILLDFCFELNSVVTAAKESADHENMIWTEPHLYM